MHKIEAIIRPERLQDVQDALDELGVSGLTVSDVVGCGRQKGYTEQYRGSRANISLLPKIKVESVVPPGLVEAAVEAIVGGRAHRARSATAACSSTRSSRRSGSAPASAARRPSPRRGGGLGPLGRALHALASSRCRPAAAPSAPSPAPSRACAQAGQK